MSHDFFDKVRRTTGVSYGTALKNKPAKHSLTAVQEEYKRKLDSLKRDQFAEEYQDNFATQSTSLPMKGRIPQIDELQERVDEQRAAEFRELMMRGGGLGVSKEQVETFFKGLPANEQLKFKNGKVSMSDKEGTAVKRKKERTSMANKFLPFIVDKSTPIHIFSTLLSRSKGMNANLIASVFNILLAKGVKELRVFTSNLPEMSVTEMYANIVDYYQNLQVNPEDLEIFRGMARFVNPEDQKSWSSELNEWDTEDIMSFLLVLALRGKLDDVTTLPLFSIISDANKVFLNLPEYVKFSDSGEPIEIMREQELKNYILYRAFIAQNPDAAPVKLVLVDKQNVTGRKKFS